jgi:hypothetical protein
MPCYTGRAGHTLLKKDCQEGCACCVNTTYSCGLLKCNEEVDNFNSPDASRTYGQFLLDVNDSEGFLNVIFSIGALVAGGPGFSNLRDNGILPSVHCPFTLSIRVVEEDCTQTTIVVENGVVQSIDSNSGCLSTSGQTIQILVDGSVVLSGLSQ